MKHFYNSANDDDNNNTNDDSYDGKIREKINDIKVILCRLGNTITKNDRKKIETYLYEIENKKNFQIRKKKRL